MISVRFPRDPEFEAIVQRQMDDPSATRLSDIAIGNKDPYVPGQDPEPMHEIAEAIAKKAAYELRQEVTGETPNYLRDHDTFFADPMDVKPIPRRRKDCRVNASP